jgi:hypothetical protein
MLCYAFIRCVKHSLWYCCFLLLIVFSLPLSFLLFSFLPSDAPGGRHSGVLSDDGGFFRLVSAGQVDAFVGSEANGVTTQNYGSYSAVRYAHLCVIHCCLVCSVFILR